MRHRRTFAMMLPVGALALALAATAEPPADPTPTADDDSVAEPMPDAVRAAMMARRGARGGGGEDDLPKFDDIADGYEQVVSTADGARSLYTVWTRKKDGQMLAELPRNFDKQLLFWAYTIAGGTPTAGVQSGDLYAKWRRYDRRLALIEPNFAVRTSGDLESRKGRDRVFTDRVILDVPIVAQGKSGGPVIDLDALLLGHASDFFGPVVRGANPDLARIEKAKAFPQNVEVAYELPLGGGRLSTLAYSISVLPERTGYQPRAADERVGFFATTHRDIGDAAADSQWVRYVNRWNLEKADPKLSMSPPKEPIVFYLEHTLPVRYRRWVRDGVLEWNRAFERVGIVNAIEVYQQDARTGAHMDKDPEDARYNFVLWTNANMGFAIGPSRVDPRTGQILDADIVMDEGFITSWVRAWRNVIPQQAMEGFTPQTLAWLEDHPTWDPRVRLAPPAERDAVISRLRAERAARALEPFGTHPAAHADPTLLGDDPYDGLAGRISQVNGLCMHAAARSLDIAMFRLAPELFTELAADVKKRDDDGKARAARDDDDDEADDDDDDEADDEDEDEDGDEDEVDDDDRPATRIDMLDGVPESFIGPLMKDVVMHEVGHTLGLRHNFKASTIHTLAEINTEAFRGRAQTGSVMDYNPINVNFEDGPVQGDYTMVTLGPYDYWAIEYGYTFDRDLKPILARVAEDDLPYATDEDTWGPDPLARRFDYSADPLDYAASQLRLVQHLRGEILDRMVKDGDSWAKSREAYEILLGRHVAAVSIAANWLGGSYVHRDKKGDPGGRDPVVPVEAEQQRRALELVVDSTFDDAAFGLTPELLSKMTVDKWWDEGGFGTIFEDPTWPVHDRIAGIQAAALTMVLNPTSLNRIYDNEFRIPGDEDAITVPEVMFTVRDAIWSEIEGRPTRSYSARRPLIGSLRRNLQSEHVDRLIDLSLPNAGFGPAAQPVRNLSVLILRDLHGKMDDMLEKHAARLDPYSEAHLAEARDRIARALDAQYIYNTDDISTGGGGPVIMFGDRP